MPDEIDAANNDPDAVRPEDTAPASEGVTSDDPSASAALGPTDDAVVADTASDDIDASDDAEVPDDADTQDDADADAARVEQEGRDIEKRAAEEGVPVMELLMAEGDYLPGALDRGDVVMGTVVRKDDDQLILDVGAKREGLVPASDLARLPKGAVDAIKVGDEVEVVVLRKPSGRDGEMLVSLSQALTRLDWTRAQEALDSGDTLELPVAGVNKGGALVDFGALQGFIPKSHLVSHLEGSGAPTTLAVKVLEVNRRQRRLILSERKAAKEVRASQKDELLSDLAEGDVRTGRVTSVTDFGVFVDIGGADGLVHISELTYERGRHPKDVVRIGEEVRVMVLNLDRARRRIGLSIKRLADDPWAVIDDNHYVGQILDGAVTNITTFGAFVRLPTGLEGLVHISEIDDRRLEHPREALRVGQEVTVEILTIDSERQRIGLSMRRVPEQLRVTDTPTETEIAPAPESESEPEVEVEVEVEVETETEGAASDNGSGTSEDDIEVMDESVEPADGHATENEE